MRRRLFRVAALAGILALAGCLLSCAQDQPAGMQSQRIDGLRTDPDHRGLVASYTGGACDGPARLVLTESRTRIEASVMVEQRSVACRSVGILRTVKARLAKPIGQRVVWVDDRKYIPFDGARLLAPSTLPRGFDGFRERGMSTDLYSAPAGSVTTTTWVLSRFDSSAVPTGGVCAATRGSLEVRIGPASHDPSVGRTKVATVKIGAATAQLYRLGTSKEPDGWVYAWTIGRSSVEVGNIADCVGDRLLSNAELLGVDGSLRPV